MERLEGRVAIVTGAGSGIGLAASEAFVAESMRVVMTDIEPERLDEQATRLREQGADVHPIVLDVRDPDAVERAGQEAVDRYGALNVVVNNAGIVNRGLAWELTLDEWQRVLDVNLWGVIHGIRAFVPHVLASGEEGHIVNVASMAAVLALDRLGPYTAAKHGVLGLSDVLREDFKAVDAPVGVSVVMPGRIKTGLNPVGTVEASTVAANIVDAIRVGRDYVFTDHHSTKGVEARLQAIIASRSQVKD